MIIVAACFRSETKAIRPRDGVRVLHTAMGSKAADDVAEVVTEHPALFLSTGFSGGLASDLRLGDLVIADEIRFASEIIRIDRALLKRVQTALAGGGLMPRVGAIECVERVLAPARKRELAAHGGLCVDLESGPLARWARSNDIPFVSCRVVLDAADDELPFSGCTALWASVLRHPLEAVRVGRAASVAARELGAAVGCLSEAWGTAR